MEPGTVVTFTTNDWNGTLGYLHVLGKLQAVGTPADSIVFTRTETDGYWGLIHFDQADTTSIMQYCSVSYASRINLGSSLYGAVYFDSCGGTVDKCTIRKNDYYGINVRNHSRATITDSRISDNGWSGIYARQGSVVTATGNIINDNDDYGIYMRSAATGFIQNNTIHRSRSHGIYLIEGANPHIIGNDIAQNSDSGIDLDQCNIVIEDNQITDNLDGIYSSGAFGLVIRNNTIADNINRAITLDSDALAVVSGNTISGSNTGISVGEDGTPSFFDNEISNCEMGINSYRATSIITSCRIHDCTTGIYFNTWEDGSAICNLITNNDIGVYLYHHSCSQLVNNTITANTTGVRAFNSGPQVINCIVSGNTMGNFDISGDTTNSQILYSLTGDSTLPEGFSDNGNNLVNIDPQLSLSGDFTLLPTSPCIDAGKPDMSFFDLPETDLNGLPRIWNGRIDMGVYEYPVNLPPEILAAEPELTVVEATEDQTLNFTVSAFDIQPITFQWYVDHVLTTCTDSVFACSFDTGGGHGVTVRVSDGTYTVHHDWIITIPVISTNDNALPCLTGIYPNPFRQNVRIAFSLPNSHAARMEICNLRGQVIKRWDVVPGAREIAWDGCDESSRPLGNGVYLCRLSSGNTTLVRRLTLIR
jgi:parallel beta-helix repeat protein